MPTRGASSLGLPLPLTPRTSLAGPSRASAPSGGPAGMVDMSCELRPEVYYPVMNARISAFSTSALTVNMP
jgi:hypothetical protein